MFFFHWQYAMQNVSIPTSLEWKSFSRPWVKHAVPSVLARFTEEEATRKCIFVGFQQIVKLMFGSSCWVEDNQYDWVFDGWHVQNSRQLLPIDFVWSCTWIWPCSSLLNIRQSVNLIFVITYACIEPSHPWRGCIHLVD